MASRVLVVAAFAAVTPAALQAQSLFDLFAAVRQGGGWVSIPVESGQATVRTRALPTAGLELNGCMQVWAGHSGRWDIRARDTFSGQRLERHTASGQPVPFSVETGAWAQLDVEVRWSERRDTTLLLWVGLERRGRPVGDACEPVYASGGPT